jgi:hypothetical protein
LNIVSDRCGTIIRTWAPDSKEAGARVLWIRSERLI